MGRPNNEIWLPRKVRFPLMCILKTSLWRIQESINLCFIPNPRNLDKSTDKTFNISRMVFNERPTRKSSHHRASCSWPQNKMRNNEKVAHIHSSNNKNNVKVKTKTRHIGARNNWLGTQSGANYFDLITHSFKIWPLRKTYTINIPNNQLKKVWFPCYNGNKEADYK